MIGAHRFSLGRAPEAFPVISAVAGGLAIAACFLRFELWPLAWLAFIPILAAIERSASAKAAARIGWMAGMATNLPAFYWLVGTIHSFGGFPLWVSLLFYLVLSSYSSLQFVLLALTVRRTGFGPVAIFPALVWVALEFLYPNLFPWRLANTQFPVLAFLQVGEVTGPYGLSLVMVWVSSALALAMTRGAWTARTALLSSIAAAFGVWGFGMFRLPAIADAMAEAPAVRVGIIQGNLSIEEKGDLRFFESNLATYRRLTRVISPQVDVTIWPETVITEPLPRELKALPSGAVATLGISGPLLTGALTYSGTPENPRYYNSVILLDRDGQIRGLSDKQILMPFGEYLPLGSVFPGLKNLSPMTGDFQAGTAVVPLEVPESGRFAPLNCYEDLSASIARQAAYDGKAEVLFAVANDAWFGATAAPYQHEALALWRAIENRRFLVRVTNTGVTDVIDASGRVRLRLPAFEAATAVCEVKRLRMKTLHMQIGDTFAWLAAVAAAFGLIRGRRNDPVGLLG